MKKNKIDEEKFRLTPKGYLSILMDDNVKKELIWDMLKDFVELTALKDGYKSGTPVLIFDKEEIVSATIEGETVKDKQSQYETIRNKFLSIVENNSDLESVWDCLEKYVELQARRSGLTDEEGTAVPALIFTNNGIGVFMKKESV